MTVRNSATLSLFLGSLALIFVIGCASTYDRSDEEGEVAADDDEADELLVPHIGGVASDHDGDGYLSPADCDDLDATIFPGADESCDLVDNNCDGVIDEGFDFDGDGYTSCGGDCDDFDDRVHPDAPDLCDGVIDNDCDGFGDPQETDNDLDFYSECNGDCDDTDPLTYPGAPDVCDEAWDNNCDGEFDALDLDNDFDSYSECNGDCDDNNPQINPLATEYTNGVDDDCDGEIDED